LLPDVRLLPPDQRAQAAWKVHEAPDFALPPLKWLNDRPCASHPELRPWCAQCGVRLRSYQRTGAAWLFLSGRGLLGDTMGTGKTIQAAALLAMCKETGELSPGSRCVVVCRAQAVRQWGRQLRRLLPGVAVVTAAGTQQQRLRQYASAWEVAVVSDRTFAPQGGQNARDGDVGVIEQFPVSIFLYDDLDAMRNPKTRTFAAVCRLAGQCERVHALHATPLQKRLKELHTFLVPVGGLDVFGDLGRFERRYTRQRQEEIWIPDRRVDPTGRKRRKVVITKDAGVREEALPEFRRLLAPLVLRRTATDLDGEEGLPDVISNTVWVEPLPQQRARYDELRKGVLRRLREGGTEVSPVEAGVAFTRGAQICSGLAALDDGADVSAKLDWLEDKLTGDLAEEKVVCFVYFTPNVAALSARLGRLGVGHVLLWSPENDPRVRDERVRRFTEDPACRVLIGTTTIEMSLNLQASRHLVGLDTVMNPARMSQIVGRIRRLGSAHQAVFFHHLLMAGTQEESYPVVLGGEQAMADAVWDERSAVFEKLTSRQVMEMIAGQAA
jgi:SNF2 family DNA or RNA helicase